LSDIFQEVDEEVRREQALKLWRRYGSYLLAVALAIVVGVGGYMAWRNYRQSQAEAQGARFAAALVLAEKDAGAAEAFAALAKDAGAGYRALALLQEASAQARAKNGAAAVAVYDRLAADGDIEPVWRDLGRLLAVLHVLDTAPADELDRRLAPLLGAGPWQYTARELAAAVRLKAGDTKAAREGYRQLADDAAAPAGVRARAAELLAALGGKE
jgi:hypothetical protein